MHFKCWFAGNLFLGLLSFFPGLLSAQGPKGRFLLIPKAGAAIPLGEFGKWFDGGFHIQGDLEYFVTNDFSLGFGAAYSQHTENEGNNGTPRIGEPGDTILQFGGAKTEIFPFALTAKYRVLLRGRINPFLQAGPVLYVTKDVIPNAGEGRERKTATLVSRRGGYTAGFGILIEVTPNLSFLAAAAYNRILDSDFPFGYAVLDGGLAFLL